jgi:DNA invertase Pin-like site-specific DNA recombinase
LERPGIELVPLGHAPIQAAERLLETMETIREAGARFESLSEPWANSTSHAGKLIMTVFAGIAEFERDLIRERTSAGREVARRRGIHLERPQKLNIDQINLVRRLINEGKPIREIRRHFQRPHRNYLPALHGGLIRLRLPGLHHVSC